MRTKPRCLVLAAAFVAATSLSARAQTGSNFGFGGTTVRGGGSVSGYGSVGGSEIWQPQHQRHPNLGSTMNGSGTGGSSLGQ